MKNVLKIVLTIFVTTLLLFCCANILEKKDSQKSKSAFIESKCEYDVFILGSSHVQHGILVSELWNDYGIKAYNLAKNGVSIPVDYGIYKLALKYHKPKLVIVDCFGINNNFYLNGKNKNLSFANTHKAFDAFPLTIEKIDIINELINHDEIENYNTDVDLFSAKFEFLFDFALYHSRWNELTKIDFVSNRSFTNGDGAYLLGTTENDIPKSITREKKFNAEIPTKYLQKIVDLSKENNIQVLLIYYPFPAIEELQKGANFIYDFANENGLKYINFLDMNVVNYVTDCSDGKNKSNIHLNVSGARKVTDYLGKYINNNFSFQKPTIEEISYFNNNYILLNENKINLFKNTKDFLKYLLLMTDKHFDYEIIINDKMFLDEKRKIDYLGNLGIKFDNIMDNNVITISNLNNNEIEYHKRTIDDKNDCMVKISVIDRNGKTVATKKF